MKTPYIMQECSLNRSLPPEGVSTHIRKYLIKYSTHNFTLIIVSKVIRNPHSFTPYSDPSFSKFPKSNPRVTKCSGGGVPRGTNIPTMAISYPFAHICVGWVSRNVWHKYVPAQGLNAGASQWMFGSQMTSSGSYIQHSISKRNRVPARMLSSCQMETWWW